MKNKTLLTTCAVGDLYIEKVLSFLETDFSKNFNIHILTDKPYLFPKGPTVERYKEPIFNFFDKFIFGINKILENQSLGLLYDADELVNLERDYSYFDFDLPQLQFFQYWTDKGTLSSLPSEQHPFWDFFQKIIKREEIQENDVLLVHEDRMLFPLQDYSEFLTIFKSMKEPFTKNSYDHHGHKGGVGNGEGVALGYTLLKTNMPYKVIFGSNP